MANCLMHVTLAGDDLSKLHNNLCGVLFDLDSFLGEAKSIYGQSFYFVLKENIWTPGTFIWVDYFSLYTIDMTKQVNINIFFHVCVNLH